jgi:hypothetical protein
MSVALAHRDRACGQTAGLRDAGYTSAIPEHSRARRNEAGMPPVL